MYTSQRAVILGVLALFFCFYNEPMKKNKPSLRVRTAQLKSADLLGFAAKEALLFLLFPRRCPVCEKIRTFPKSIEPLTNLCSFFICKDCFDKLSFIEGALCTRCGRKLASSASALCPSCKNKKRTFDSGAALFDHDDAAKKIIYDFKFHQQKDHADLLGFLLALRMKERLQDWNPEVIIPVPLHKKRLRERGFNQALLLAQTLSFWLKKACGFLIPVDACALQRVRKTQLQKTLHPKERMQNVKDAFALQEHSPFPYKRVLLVDDIFTTGATLDACAKTLKAGGCEQVFFLTASMVT